MATTTELYKRYRPLSFKQVIGQAEACRFLAEKLRAGELPHTLLFTGPSGCGKTTLARILQHKLACHEMDFVEINCADFRGIDMVREIRNRMHLAPLGGGKVRIWLIDECHMLSKDAQNGFLKMLEDTPAHVYFLLATTDPEKLLSTVKTRCTQVKCKLLTAAMLEEVVGQVLAKEGKKVTDVVLAQLIEHAEGSARKVLVLLDAIINLEGEEEQLKGIVANDHRAQSIQLARLLMSPGSPWSAVAKLIKEIDEEPESVRYMVLGYASSVLLNSNNARAFFLLEVFSNNFYDNKRAGLVLACYTVTKSPIK